MRLLSNGSIGCIYRKPIGALRCLHRALNRLLGVVRSLHACDSQQSGVTRRVDYLATLGAAPGATGSQTFGQQWRSGLRQLLSVREDALGALGCRCELRSLLPNVPLSCCCTPNSPQVFWAFLFHSLIIEMFFSLQEFFRQGIEIALEFVLNAVLTFVYCGIEFRSNRLLAFVNGSASSGLPEHRCCKIYRNRRH